MGHSWGASILSVAAGLRPAQVAALVLGDAGHRDWADYEPELLDQTLEQWCAIAKRTGCAPPAARRVAAMYEVAVDDPVVDVGLQGMVDDGAGGLVAVAPVEVLAAAMYGAIRGRPSDGWAAIAEALIPTQLVLATEPEEARLANQDAAKRFTAAVPQADVVFAEGATHALIRDLRDDLGTIVARWLTGPGGSLA